MKQLLTVNFKRLKSFPGFYFGLIFLFFSNLAIAQKEAETEDLNVDIVFCMDLSGSTNGLIDNFRESIWGVVNQVENMSPKPTLRIGVVGFSRPSFGKSSAYVKILGRLTTDYDHLVAELWKLKPEVEKGDQFVSNALEVAGFEMNWTKSKNAIKIIFLIGNGNVDTGSSDFRTVVSDLSFKNIQIVPVYCLREKKTKEILGWQQIGRISGFQYESIWVMKRKPLVKPVPDEGKLKELSSILNDQLLPFTKEGNEVMIEIKTCDNKAILAGPVATENRLFYRTSESFLRNLTNWDLTSMELKNPSDLLPLDLSLVPDSLKNLTVNQLFNKIQMKREIKKRTVADIKKLLPDDRQKYLNELVSRDEFDSENVLEMVILKNISSLLSTMQPKK